MKKIIFILAFTFSATMLFSQPWLENLPQNKSKDKLTFFDYQDAFHQYWAPFHVDEGYYVENGVKKKAAGWKQFKRWEYDLEGRINPLTGEFPHQTGQEVYEEYLKENRRYKSPNSANWTSLGPYSSTGGYAGVGRLNCIAFHPADNNTYWVGAASGGLWITTNNGSSWTCLTDNNGVLAVSDIVIPTDFATSNTIYIATGDKDHWDNRSIGVLKSTDGGSTWSTTGINYSISDGKMVYRLLLHPGNNQTILAATSDGVYKTSNGGTTWSNQLTTTAFIDMEYKPGDFNTLYGSTSGGEIYVTTNGGGSWIQSFNDPDAYRIELAVSASQPTWLYAIAVASNSGLYGIYKSTNSGSGFTQVFAGTTLNLLGWDSGGGDSGGQGWYDLGLAVAPTNANTVLVGGVNTWRSTNGGISWSIVNHWWGDGVPAVHADKHNLTFRTNGDLFECNDGGVYVSANNGTSWTDKTNGMVISQMYKLGVSDSVPDEVITGLQDNGTKLISGGTWDDVKGGDGMECLIDYSDVNIQYGTYVNGQISRTTDHWSSSANIQPSGAGSGAWVTPYIIDPVNPLILYAGYADVWKTTNRGNSWTKISTMNATAKIRSIAIAPSNTQYLYVADYTHVWKTTNGGTSWTDITGTLPVDSANVTSIAVKNDDANTLWITMSNYIASKVFQSADGGASWTNISTGLPSIPAYSIVQNKQSTAEVQLYAGTEVGVYFKKGTDNWISYNTGLANVKIGEIEISYSSNPQDSKIKAATFGRGLWESPVYYSCTPLPVPTITGPSLACVADTGVIYSTETGMTDYSWTVSPGGTITGGSGTYQITVTWDVPGSQTVSVNYTNSNFCTAESPTVNIVTVNPLPIPGISGSASACAGDTGIIYTTEPGMTGYTWTISPGGTITGGSGTNQITVTWDTGGTQSLSVIYTDSNFCTASPPTVYYITVNPNPLANAGFDQEINYGAATILEGSATNGSGSYSWYWEPDSLLVDPGVQNPVTVNLTSSTLYTLTVTDLENGCAGNDQVLVTVTGGPLGVDVTATPDTSCPGSAVQLMAVTSGGTGNNTYLWTSNPAGFNSTVYNPVANPEASITYIVDVNDGFAGVTDSVFVTVISLPGIPETPTGPDTVDLILATYADYFTTPAPSAISYTWELNPVNAGTISGSGTTGTAVWDADFTGTAYIRVKSVNSCGESLWSAEKITMIENTGIGIVQNQFPYTVHIFPNPATDLLTIEYPAYTEKPTTCLDFFAIQGNFVKRVFIREKTTQVDISSLPVAIYMIKMTIGSESMMMKFVKTRN